MDGVSELEQTAFGGDNRKWWTLAAVSLGLFMIMLDNTVVNVALPSIQHDLGLSLSELEWVVAGYALTFAAFMLTGGKLADLLGRRLMFVAGLAVFTAASLACGLATGPEMLIGARVVQGVGAALMNPATLSIITATFPPRQRGTAIGIWAGASALALAIGPLVGGLLAEHVDWSWIFFVNVPVGAIAIAAAYLFIDESKDTSHGQRPTCRAGHVGDRAVRADLRADRGELARLGVDPHLGAFAIAAGSLVLFVVLELAQRRPMLDLRLFRNATFSGANAAMLFIALAMFGVFFYVSLYIQQILGYSPVEAGASFLPATLLIAFLAPIVGKQSDRIGSRWLTGGGMLLAAVSLLIFSRLDTGSSYWDILPGLLFLGVGMALTMTPTTAAAMSSVPRDQAGVGSAVLNSMRQVGGSLGIAVTGAIVAHVSASSLADGHSRPVAFVDGFQRGLEVAAAIAVAGAVIAVATMRSHSERRQDEAPLEEPAFQEAA